MLTYASYVSSLANLIPSPGVSLDANFATVLPNAIDDAEQRIYRDLDLLNTITSDSSAALATGTKSFNLPSLNGTFVVVERINVITPAGQTNPDLGTRNPLTPAAPELITVLFPSSTGSAVPQYFGMHSQSTVVVGPWPNQAYTVEVVGTVRPAALSASNTTTLLSVYFPDLLLAASMEFIAAYMKNFGAAADDPKMGMTWNAHYNSLLQSAQVEEARKKFTSQGWSSRAPAPLATPPRT